MSSLEILHPEYSVEHHAVYHLYLEISPNKISALFVDPSQLTCTRLVSSESVDLKAFLSQLNAGDVKHALVSIQNIGTHLIPAKEFDQNNLPEYLQLVSTQIIEREDIRWDSLSSPEANLCYFYPLKEIQYLESVFNSVSIGHHASFFLYLCALDLGNIKASSLFINQNDNELDLACFDNKVLVFYNRFPIHGDNDALYHCMNCIEVLNLDASELKAWLSGDLSKKQIEEFSKYLGQINLRSPDTRLKYAVEMTEQVQKSFHSIFQLHLCE